MQGRDATGRARSAQQKNEAEPMTRKAEKPKSGVRAKVKHPFRVIKRQFGFVKVRYLKLKKNTAQRFTLFALLNLWRVRDKLIAAQT